MLMRREVLVCQNMERGKADEGGEHQWVYIGSHNFSSAGKPRSPRPLALTHQPHTAWGKLQKDNTQLHVSNYELGVLLPPRTTNALWKDRIPFLLPAPHYLPTDQAHTFE